MENSTDLFIVGGGINGAAIAADAAGRGLSVTLCEKNDLASATSSASSKLIHGGLRYLEFYEFGLVRKALQEREILLKRAPHIITPLEFILPHEKHLRPAWLIRLGLFLYDHLSRRNYLPGSRGINLKNNQRGAALMPQFTKGFSYFDCFTDDARLVIENALSAKLRGAAILTHHEVVSVEVENKRWKIGVKNGAHQPINYYYSKIFINAAGPWINAIQTKITGKPPFDIQLVKGSHIIVPKLYDGDFAYILQNKDQRIVFAMPYQRQFTLIGTTDIAFSSDLDTIQISPEEITYLCGVINIYFKKNIAPENIISTYAGVRGLQDNHAANVSKTTRDYKLVLDTNDCPPLLTVIGGKLTTHRYLAEDALNQLKPFFADMKPAWTKSAALPGGDFPNGDFSAFYQTFKNKFAWLPDRLSRRLARNYGIRAELLLAGASRMEDLGQYFAAGLCQKEVDYLIQHEWACLADDILWRRTKLGLFFSEDDKIKLTAFLNQRK